MSNGTSIANAKIASQSAGGAALSGLLSGGLGLGGALLSFFSQRRASKQARRSQEEFTQFLRDEAARQRANRQRALGVAQAGVDKFKFSSILGTDIGKRQEQTLEDRIAGRGLFDIDINKQTAPFAAQRRAGLEQTTAQIGSAAAARGLGRSTIPVGQIGQASQAAERDIEQRVAQLQLTREQLRSGERERAVTARGQLAVQEQGGLERVAKFGREGQFALANIITGNSALEQRDNFAIADSIRQGGIQQATDQLQQALILGSGLSGAGEGAANALSLEALLTALSDFDTDTETEDSTGAKTNIAGNQTARAGVSE